MRFYYCYDFAGWFSPEYNEVIPPNAVEVEEDTRLALLAGTEAGFVIVKGKDGMPELADRPGPSLDQLQKQERVWRDTQLARTDPLITRHRDELEFAEATTLTDERYRQLQSYRSKLRSWPELTDFPAEAHRPLQPEWFAEATL
ncbi:hypothetical protein A7318_15915 [Pseudomonas lurida]|uniref:hypothetical protein n=1 Tax=Pseudomonas lurida TaxID=244566 RepID=UPI00083CDF6D|nr:hypothetical protein [Pseudomonas lurida]AOE80028.1 hypothetical protein A7318_15915 [Pseudomonas lurida]